MAPEGFEPRVGRVTVFEDGEATTLTTKPPHIYFVHSITFKHGIRALSLLKVIIFNGFFKRLGQLIHRDKLQYLNICCRISFP